MNVTMDRDMVVKDLKSKGRTRSHQNTVVRGLLNLGDTWWMVLGQ
jgi:hypothetical protein